MFTVTQNVDFYWVERWKLKVGVAKLIYAMSIALFINDYIQ